MTICELIEKKWLGGNASLKTSDGRFTITIDENGDIVRELPLRIPSHVMCGDEWELEYPQEYSTNAVVEALSTKLDNDLSVLYKSEWNDFEYREAREAIYAIARALNFKIEKMSQKK